VKCDVTADPALEIWAAPRRAELLERALGVTIRVEAGPVDEGAPATETTITDATAAVLAADALES
jgi:hypothetical protein